MAFRLRNFSLMRTPEKRFSKVFFMSVEFKVKYLLANLNSPPKVLNFLLQIKLLVPLLNFSLVFFFLYRFLIESFFVLEFKKVGKRFLEQRQIEAVVRGFFE